MTWFEDTEKIRFLGGGTKNQYLGENCLKRWGQGFGQFEDLREGLAKKGGGVFLRGEGWYFNPHYGLRTATLLKKRLLGQVFREFFQNTFFI